ncbi:MULTISPECIES: hypothetical protein [Sphingomonadaceae]|jgi:hypothetical protein|nr:hypothetical protein CA234_18990 [Sphingomonas sp. ABOLE]
MESVMRLAMDEAMIRDAAEALAARFKDLLVDGLARSFTLSRDEVVLALGFTQSVADLLTPTIPAPAMRLPA